LFGLLRRLTDADHDEEGALTGAACATVFATSARATADFCVIVRNTPDGFLALREGPGTQFRVKAKLQPGELLLADTGSCRDDFCDETRQWIFIEHVPRLDGKLEKAKHLTQGWVASKFTTEALRCPGED
jgi:hypothetical protein